MQSKPNAGEFARTKLPWIASGIMLLIYLLTLNQWISVRSMVIVSKVTGWDWTLPTQWPLFFTLTYPIRWLPVNTQPVALNVFAAICAALAIYNLVRSVALLPHDRTDEQRIRQRHPAALLVTNFAWAPPALAAALLGLEMTMWEHATAATNESLDILVFSFLIRCLLEFRISKEQKWLSRLAVVYGLGVTNSWALIAFFPFFLGALIWIRGKSFFNLKFIVQMVALGLCGMLLYMVLPLVWSLKGHGDTTFGEALRSMLASQKAMVFNTPNLRSRALILSLASILPVVIMGIRFPAGFGDVSTAGATITNTMFKLIHVLFATATIWVAFAEALTRKLRLGLPFLSFYYLGALAAGYYVGYLMLVSTEAPKRAWRPATPLAKLINPVVQALAWAAVLLVPIGLLVKNFKAVKSENGKLLRDFAESIASQLPAKPAILLSEDAFQLALMEAWYSRSGGNPHILVNPRMLPYPVYHRDMVRRYGERWPSGGTREDLKVRIDRTTIATALLGLARSNLIYTLHPGFDYYYEVFYGDPKGLVSEFKIYPSNMIYAPKLDAARLDSNRAYWKGADSIVNRAVALTPLKIADATYVAGHYSRGLNKWGVDLQRADKFSEATEVFDTATTLNTNNIPARFNLEYNEFRVKGTLRPSEGKAPDDFFGPYRSWESLLGDNGPFDVPEYLYAGGHAFMQQSLYRQAADQFARAAELDPTNNIPKIALATALITGRWLDDALDLVRKLQTATNTTLGQQLDLVSMESAIYFARKETNKAEATLTAALEKYPTEGGFYESLNELYRASKQWSKAQALVNRQISTMPTNVNLRLQAVDLAISGGDTNSAAAELKELDKLDPSNQDAAMYRIFLAIQMNDFQRALTLVNAVLERNEKNSAALTYKGIIHMELKENDKAIEAFDKALKSDRSNVAALRNRAIVNLRAGNLSDAKSDYELLLSNLGKSYTIFYGLGEIAYQKKDKADALKNFESYLQYAPTNGPPELMEERKKVEAKVQELKAGSK